VTGNPGEPVVIADEPGTRLSRRASVWIISVFMAIVLGALMSLVHLPYAILQPGPVTNTLGNGPEGKPLITVAGKATYQGPSRPDQRGVAAGTAVPQGCDRP